MHKLYFMRIKHYLLRFFMATANPTVDFLLVSKELYTVEGSFIPLYRNSIITRQYSTGSHIGVSVNNSLTNPIVRYMGDSLTLQASEVSNNDTVEVFQFFDSDNNKYYRTATLKKKSLASLSGASGQAIVFGDSITDFNLLPSIATPLTSWGANVSFKGLRSDGGIANEGRSSWELAILIGLRTQYSSTVYRPSDTTDDGLQYNPFIKIASPTDIANHPTWCFENTPSTNGATSGKDREKNYTESQASGGYSGDYYIFDFARYNSTNLSGSISSGNTLVAVCNLGFNDLNHNNGSAQSITDALLAMEIFASQVLSFKSDATVIFCPTLVVNRANTNWTAMVSWMQQASKKVDALKVSLSGDIRCFYPMQHVDRCAAYNYSTNVQDVSAINDSKVGSISDDLHPGELGQKQIGFPLACLIANCI